MATLIQDDLKQLGMDVHVVPLEFRSLLDRVLRTHDYEACLLSLVEADADPNVDMNVWLSSGATHLWNPQQKSPATAWEAEIDGLMRRQMVTRKYAERKLLFDRVQELLMENLPLIPLVSPTILPGQEGAGELSARRSGALHAVEYRGACWRAPAAGGVNERDPGERLDQRPPGRGVSARKRAGLARPDRPLQEPHLFHSAALRHPAPGCGRHFQRVCLDLFNELPRLRDAEALQAWLIRVTTHKCYHWKRRQSSLESEWDENDMAARSADAAAPPDMVPNWNGNNWSRRRLRSSRRGAGR